ncbi:MAG: hypothetical protein ABSG80_14750 [Verrucomicrobiota bacterium]|jgi:hypothetical protein
MGLYALNSSAQRSRLNFQPAVTCLAPAGLRPFATPAADATNHPAAHNPKHTCVIVPGAWDDGWDWKRVDRLCSPPTVTRPIAPR